MPQTGKTKYRLIVGVVLVVVALAGVFAFNDFTPIQTVVEKTVAYEKK